MVLSYSLGILRPEVSVFATTSGGSGDRLGLGPQPAIVGVDGRLILKHLSTDSER
jgi:hypothetical protein